MKKQCPQFTYDPDGQLVKLSGPKRMVYIDGIYEKDMDGGVETKYYFGLGGRVAMRTGGTLRYLANDHLGSTAFVMDASGGLESQVRYYPYGMTWSQSATPATDRLFTGHQQMGAKSGTYYANARFYSADIGRFPTPDSLVGGGYTYVGNNPTNYVDPTGHFMEGCCFLPWDKVNWPKHLSAGNAPPPGGGDGDGSSPTVTPWPLRWLPLPERPNLPVSGASPCAYRIACCWMGGQKYVCGTWGSDPSGSGGGLLTFLSGVARSALNILASDCGTLAISVIGLIAIGVATGGTAYVAISSGFLVTTSVSTTLTSATAIGYLASGAAGGAPYEVVGTTVNFASGTIQGAAGCVG